MSTKQVLLALEMDDYIRRHVGRRQQLMNALRNEYKVIYCDRMNSFIHEFYHRGFKVFNEFRVKTFHLADDFIFIRIPPVFLPFASSFRFVNRINCWLYEKILKSTLKKLMVDSVDVIWVGHPFAVDTNFDARVMVHDCFDDHLGFQGKITQFALPEIERDLMNVSDITFFSSQELLLSKKHLCKRYYLVRNGVDFNHFYAHHELSSQHNNTILYSGVLGHWVDLDIIDKLSQVLPELDILLVGPDRVDAKEYFKSRDNVTVTGQVEYKVLPQLYHKAAICIIPFKENLSLIKNTNPIKLYEYLASGKPVLSTNFSEVELDEGVVEFFQLKGLRSQVLNIIKKNSVTDIEIRQKFAGDQSWLGRSQDIKKQVQALNNDF